MEKIMPMCPFCNRETTFVVRNSYNNFHCNNCGGDFTFRGDPIIRPDIDDDDGHDCQKNDHIWSDLHGAYFRRCVACGLEE